MEQWQTQCTACGEGPVDATAVRLLTPTDPSRAARAVFRCGRCGHHGSVVVRPAVARWLAAIGAPVSHGHPSLGARDLADGRRLAVVRGESGPEGPGQVWGDRGGAA